MRVFVTGASGWVGRGLVPELIAAGHEVTGLARSDAATQALQDAGAKVRLGSLDDLGTLHDAAASGGVDHPRPARVGANPPGTDRRPQGGPLLRLSASRMPPAALPPPCTV